MSKPEISILMPGIRHEKWDQVYDSIAPSTNRSFELIIVGPYPLTPKLSPIRNVKYCKDFGSPMRASQIAGLLAEGKLIFSLMSDDAVFLPGVLDKMIDTIYQMPYNYKNIVVAPYIETRKGGQKQPYPQNYYYLNTHDGIRSPLFENDWVILNTAILYRDFFDELGGWNCEFQACPPGLNDLAVRAQKEGGIAKLISDPILDCEQLPGHEGDHGPIHEAQTHEDRPLFAKKWKIPPPEPWPQPSHIDMNNWKNAEMVWQHRFKK